MLSLFLWGRAASTPQVGSMHAKTTTCRYHTYPGGSYTIGQEQEEADPGGNGAEEKFGERTGDESKAEAADNDEKMAAEKRTMIMMKRMMKKWIIRVLIACIVACLVLFVKGSRDPRPVSLYEGWKGEGRRKRK